MSKLRNASALALFVAAGPAFAADLYSQQYPSVPSLPSLGAPPADWEGPYAGAHVGYGWSDFDQTRHDSIDALGGSVTALPDGVSNTIEGNGFLGGVQAGYSAQNGNFVAGVEGDIALTGIDGDEETRFTAGGVTRQTDQEAELNWVGTARARAGVAVDRFLVYGTGGLAFGQTETTIRQTDTAFGGPRERASASDKSTNFGWTVGAGAEGIINDRLTAKAEYLYVDIEGDRQFHDYDFGAARAETDSGTHIVRTGLNYRFGR